MIESANRHQKTHSPSWVRNCLNIIFSRATIVGCLFIAQLVLIWFLTSNLVRHSLALYLIALAFSLLVVVYLVSTRAHPAYKLAWAVLILALPPMGAVIYLLYNLLDWPIYRQAVRNQSSFLPPQDMQVWRQTAQLPAAVQQQMHYLSRFQDFPVYRHTQTNYLSLGEDFFISLQQDLRQAKKFIFLEYYIIQEGQMWDSILKILRQQVRKGVQVRLMYDDIGCLLTLPANYRHQLARFGIKTKVLNRFHPFSSFQMNNRDHRKIAVIDGQIGYMSGINLADEYINAYPKHGHWKDTAIRLEGLAVQTLTAVFLQLWTADDETDIDIRPYLSSNKSVASDGWVVPFADDPKTHENISKHVYLNLINKAQKSIFITSPYLVPDNELLVALTLAAKNGVDVTIIVPGQGDHWYVHLLSQSFYWQFLEAGVRVYEYKPGFIHSKTILVDDEQAVIGTINCDFRSFYLLYECGTYLYQSRAVSQLRSDIDRTLAICQPIGLSEVKEIRFSRLITRSLLRLVAPLI